MGRRHDRKATEKQSQPLDALFAPVRQEGPLFQLRLGHEGDEPLPVIQMREVELCPAVRFEEERHDVRVEDDGGHAAGSVLACPRHSRIAARKSSVDSSSGQKLPRRSFGSRGNVSPCAAISSSAEGCPWREYFWTSSSIASFISHSSIAPAPQPATLAARSDASAPAAAQRAIELH